MLSPDRIQPNNTKNKQKRFQILVLNYNNPHRDPHIKRPQMTSSNLKLTSNESVKNKRTKLKGGDPSDSQKDGRNLIEQAFSSN